MRTTQGVILALTALFAARAVHAQADELNPPPGAAPQLIAPAPSEKGKKQEKEKDQILRLMGHAESLSRWMPNQASFLAVLNRVRDEVTAARESEFEPLREFEPHLSQLTATLSRMEARVSPVQAAVEICDPARRADLFLLFLDTLEVDGRKEVQARICEKIASEAGTAGALSQVCVATDLAFLAARSMHDLIVMCDASLERAQPDVNAGRFERLSGEIAGAQAGVQESVRSAKRELTQAMTVVAGHIAEVSSVETKRLEDLTVRLEIERALQQASPYGSIYLPSANGGRLEDVRAIVGETIQNVLDSGEAANGAGAKLAAGDEQFKAGHFKQAFRLYSEAYKAAVGIPPKQK